MRRYVEEQLHYISRRYVKKFGQPDPNDTVIGYKNFRETCKDMDNLVNVLWLSGTRKSLPMLTFYSNNLSDYSSMLIVQLLHIIASLQIPFLFKLSSDFTQYVRSFPPSPKASFDLLGKLDHCFSSLLSGKDVDSGESLPGFENGLRGGMTTTDMIRCRSLVEQSRLLMVEVLSKQGEGAGDDEDEDEDDEDEDESETDNDTGYHTESTTTGGPNGAVRWDIDEERLHLDAARIFENTIIQLNERLGDQPLTSGPGVTDDTDDVTCRVTAMEDNDGDDGDSNDDDDMEDVEY